MSCIFAQAVRDLGLPRNPAAGIWKNLDRPGKKDAAGTPKAPKALSPGEVRRPLDTARTVAPQLRPLFATSFMAERDRAKRWP